MIRPAAAGFRVAGLGLLSALAIASPAGAAPTTLSTGFMDQRALGGDDRATWLQRARSVGATRVRLSASWVGIAPTQPSPAEALQPGWAGYRYAPLDAQVRAAVSQGLVPFVGVSAAPAWAEAPGRPSTVRSGGWKPDAAAFGAFMRSMAARYSGTFPDPLLPGKTLPRVAQFQLWNEPNLDTYLAPQLENGKQFAAGRFRELVNAGYSGVKAAQPRATVITAGLAPFGDYRTANPRRTPPVTFLRSALCLDAKLRRTCSTRTRFDVLAHHPYAVRKPSSGALNPEDVTIPDLGRLTRVTDAALRRKTITRRPKLWVTEVSYDSAPEDPSGVPSATLRRWIPELLWRVWRQGAETVIWYQIGDQAPGSAGFGATYQSGMFTTAGARKAAATSFRFPVLVTGRTSRRLNVWVRTPVAGKVRVQVRRGGRWSTASTVTLRTSGARSLSVPRARVTGVRAVIGTERSDVWKP